jgi:hypothetical protein
MTLANWNSADYLVEFKDIVYSGPIIGAPLEMKAGWITKYLHEVIFPDAIKAVGHGGALSGLLMGFAVVEYLAGYFAGHQSQAKDVKAFMKRYYPQQYAEYIDDIYGQLRNGLVHNLSITNPWIPNTSAFAIEERSDMHLQQRNGTIVFSIYHFLEDARRATVMYLFDLIMKPTENMESRRKFEARFNKKDGAAALIAKTE